MKNFPPENPFLIWFSILLFLALILFLYLRHTENIKTIQEYPKTNTLFPNLTHNLVPQFPYQILVIESFYFQQEKRIWYIDLLIDVYTTRILTCSVHDNLHIETKLLEGLPKDLPKHTIHHSNTGAPYLNQLYINNINKLGIQISQGQGYPITTEIKQLIRNKLNEHKPLETNPLTILEYIIKTYHKGLK